jgi:chromosome segregation ATPase
VTSIQEIVVALLGGGAVTVIAQHFFGFLSGRTKEQNTKDQKSRQDTRDGFQALFDRLQKDLDEQHKRIIALQAREDNCRAELQECRDELSRLWRRLERTTTWMSYLENELKRANIPFRPFSEAGTDEHRALPKGDGI